ncbi:O-antigen ligase family protein [Adhaeribacter soli]|uniref:O-antigen ligase family protein n=1 Tax=Adhaeribacter soli TaxID=2607655 RepID=A0A5N1IVJ9_9BACT|nr:O-antigen ligase family protein [Adhaeribacter soli]KAA9333798.1 O-antigen ligase family protein [Adhaeribacter soli]
MLRFLRHPGVLHFAWVLYFIALPFSKALSAITEVTLLVLAIPALGTRDFRTDLYRYRHVSALCLIFLALLLGLAYTENLSNGFKVLSRYHRFLIIPLIFLAHRRWLLQHFFQYLQVYVTAVAAVCIITLSFYILPPETAASVTDRLGFVLPYYKDQTGAAFGIYSPFTGRLQLGSLISLALLSAVYLVSNSYKRILNGALFALLFFTHFILGARGALLAFLIAFGLYGYLFAQQRFRPVLSRKIGNPLATLLIVFCLASALIGLPWAAYTYLKPVQSRVDQTRWEMEMYQTGQFTQYSYEHFTTLRRVASWQNLWQVVQQNPILGVGTGDYTDALEQAYTDDKYPMPVHNHNQFLMFWAMIGIWGLCLFIFILGYWLWRMRKSGPEFYFACAFLLFYILNMMPDAVLFNQTDSTAFCSFMALIGLTFRQYRPENA